MLPLYALEVSDPVLDKIEAKHGVRYSEVEEACFSQQPHVRRGREGLHQLFSRSDAGRYLFVVLAHRGDGVWSVVTARDMTDRERGLYRTQGGE